VKHRISIALILLGMFLITQFIGLWMVNAYTDLAVPYGMQSTGEATPGIISILISFIFAVAIILILMKYKWKLIIKTWFFVVITLALSISLNVIIIKLGGSMALAALLALLIAIPLTILKIFRPGTIIHNLTEFLIYPGIAVIFVSILTPITSIILLVVLSLYDAWAVWKSGLMMKMAKFQMNELRLFGGFLIPTLSKKVKAQIGRIRQKYKGKEIPKSVKKKKFKVSLAILGGGDVIFPIITAGVFLRYFESIVPALFVTFGALAGLTFLFITTKKGKAYPAMPYISTGIFLALIIWKFLI
jgi:presenilin-like A22 family membrane protease